MSNPLALLLVFAIEPGVRLHDGRDNVVHMIFVAQETVLTRLARGVARLAEILFHRTEIGRETARIALLVALEVRAAFLEGVAGQAAAIVQDAKCGSWMKRVKRPCLLATDVGEKLTTRPLPWSSSTLWHLVQDPCASLLVRKSNTAAAGS